MYAYLYVRYVHMWAVFFDALFEIENVNNKSINCSRIIFLNKNIFV